MLQSAMHARLAPVIAALLAMSLAAPTIAAEAGAKPTPRKLLSKSELRACITRETDLEKWRDALTEAHTEHTAAGAVLSAEATALSKTLRTLNSADEVAVDSYNKRNDERNRQVEKNNKQAEALNAVLADLQSAEADLIAECTARPFLKADEDAILKELGKTRRPRSRDAGKPSPRVINRSDA